MTDHPKKKTPLEEPAAEPNLDGIFGVQPDISDELLDFKIKKERAAMVAYISKRNGK